MSLGAKKGPQRKRPTEILVFAENTHDSDAIKCLAEALNPTLSARLNVQRNPTSLTRDAKAPAVKTWMERIADVVDARLVLADVVGVLVHQDSDGPDAVGSTADDLRATLIAQLGAYAYPVVPVQETESWWFLYPDAFRAVNKVSWREVKFPAKQETDAIASPKEELMRLTRRTKRVYSEADSLAVAQHIATAIKRGDQQSNSSRSWSRFTALVRSL